MTESEDIKSEGWKSLGLGSKQITEGFEDCKKSLIRGNMRNGKRENVEKEDARRNVINLKPLEVIELPSYVYFSKAPCHHVVPHLMWD